MKNVAKKLAAFALAAVVALSSVAAVGAAEPAKSPAKAPVAEQQTGVEVSGVTVNTAADGTAAVTAARVTEKSDEAPAKAVVPTSVTVKGVTYDVTTVKTGAFKNAGAVTKIVLGEKVVKVEKKGFTGAKKVKVIKVKGKKALEINKKAFKGVDTKKITVKAVNMSNKQFKKTVKALRKAGFKGKITK
ncbi:MAG: hypothetical protein Q4B57_10835 [Eubacteriales bacterium]|nr:hypothetical protein [Eubacteriales bacterium]